VRIESTRHPDPRLGIERWCNSEHGKFQGGRGRVPPAQEETVPRGGCCAGIWVRCSRTFTDNRSISALVFAGRLVPFDLQEHRPRSGNYLLRACGQEYSLPLPLLTCNLCHNACNHRVLRGGSPPGWVRHRVVFGLKPGSYPVSAREAGIREFWGESQSSCGCCVLGAVFRVVGCVWA
jgi:hypothetical protein